MSKPAQIAYFQRARCLGALAVVLLHVLSVPLADTPVEVIGHARAFVWYEAQTVLTRWAVPVFFMITGALLLDPSTLTPLLKPVLEITELLRSGTEMDYTPLLEEIAARKNELANL